VSDVSTRPVVRVRSLDPKAVCHRPPQISHQVYAPDCSIFTYSTVAGRECEINVIVIVLPLFGGIAQTWDGGGGAGRPKMPTGSPASVAASATATMTTPSLTTSPVTVPPSSSNSQQRLSQTNLYIRGLSPDTTDKDLVTLCQPW